MAHITIKNVGPIKEVSFDLNKINVFMGPQSSGKSTIAKIVSYCSWYEKNIILHTSKRPDFFEELISFHNLEESYFSSGSRIQYESELCKINFIWGDDKNSRVDVQLGNGKVFRNRKIIYIPAERNFVTLPGLGKYNETRDNILSFMYKWFLAKKDLSAKNAFFMPIKGLGDVSFYYDKDADSDNVNIGNENAIRLNHTSSGLRSCIPLLVVFNYIITNIYNTRRTQTPFEIVDIEEKLEIVKTEAEDTTEDVRSSMAKLKAQVDEMSKTIKLAKDLNMEEILPQNFNESLLEIQEQLANILGLYSDYYYSQVIIEEPELNLFPKTQQELIYYMISVLNSVNRKHQLVITTHSPFILFAINNCMMGGLVGDKIPNDEKYRIASASAWINPSDVSIYEIHEGTIKRIQDEEGIIEDNYLNQAYKENSNEYLTMLNYYDDEE